MLPRLKSNRGISMMEMMISVVIASILAALAVPNLSGAIKKMKFHNAGRSILSTMRYARSAAITLQKPHGVYFDADHRKVVTFVDLTNPGGGAFEPGDSVVRTDSVDVPVDYLGTTFADGTVIFQPDGKASASGYVTCHSYAGGVMRAFSIALTAGSGRVRLDLYN